MTRPQPRKGRGPTPQQRAFLKDARDLAADSATPLRRVRSVGLDARDALIAELTLDTSDLPRSEAGVELKASEVLHVLIPSAYPLVPPQAEVHHDRWAGHAHVLQGRRLCIYLDPGREWHPQHGAAGYLNALWHWLGTAAAGRFDAANALYHPVGGVLHQTPGTPTVVVRDDFDEGGKALDVATLQRRSDHRWDLRWQRLARASDDSTPARVLRVDGILPYAAGSTLGDLLSAIACQQPLPTQEAVLTSVLRTAQRTGRGTPTYLVVAVRHPITQTRHLIVGRIGRDASDALRSLKASRVATIQPRQLQAGFSIEWCRVSDERPEISTRRDISRPIRAFAGRTVQVWGTGGLGSWVAEFVLRAGASCLQVADTGTVTGGLLVRQNFTEQDVGRAKAEAIADRLRAISDDAEIQVIDAGDLGTATGADVIIDATVNMAFGYVLDEILRGSAHHPLVARLATDVATGSLGMAVISAADDRAEAVDEFTNARVMARSDLEHFQTFWTDPADGAELIPARGCSVPTFHGSAADLAGVAASLMSFVAGHIGTAESGTHLIALPHGPWTGPPHAYIPYDP